MRGLAVFFVAALAVASAFFYQEAGSKPLFIAGEDAGYLPPSACGPCHRAISESYQPLGLEGLQGARAIQYHVHGGGPKPVQSPHLCAPPAANISSAGTVGVISSTKGYLGARTIELRLRVQF
jgi:hypothetical protein